MKRFFTIFFTSLFVGVQAQTIAAVGRHSLALCNDSTVRSWGYNGYGQLGNGGIAPEYAGYAIPGLSGIIKVDGGLMHSLFIKSDGTVWGTGRNVSGSLGDSTTSDKYSPIQITRLSNVVQATGGINFSLFLKSDSTVWSCGVNTAGQLGIGTNTLQEIVPKKIATLSGIVQVAAGAEFSLFLKSDSTVWACGHNGAYQFGNGNNTAKNAPVKIPGLSGIIQISAGEWHSLFLKSDGSVWVAGNNINGQLGDSTNANVQTVKKINGISNVIKVEAGGLHSVFVKADGTAWACGLNSNGNNDGQLGDGTNADKNYPVQVINTWGTGKIIDAFACREHSLFLHENGTVWGSGRDNYGQLGNSTTTTTNQFSPVQSSPLCLNISTNAAEEKENKPIKIFPNPFFETINIIAAEEIKKITITNLLGQTIFCKEVALLPSNKLEINLAHLPFGVYVITTVSKMGNSASQKIVRHRLY